MRAPTDPARLKRLAVVVGSAAVVAAAVVIARNSAAEPTSGPRVGSAPLPAAVAGRTARPASTPADPPGLPAADRAAMAAASERAHRLFRPGVPVELDIPIRTPNHPDGVHARVTSNPLNPDGTLHVPADPKTVSWARQDVAPGSARGTAILTSHINYVINGRLVIGALSDLAWYAQHAVGTTISVRLADGRVLRYRIVAGREYTKTQLAASPRLRAELYDQRQVYGPAGHPSGRLLLVSCGGAFDPYTGEYEDNVFLYALPEF